MEKRIDGEQKKRNMQQKETHTERNQVSTQSIINHTLLKMLYTHTLRGEGSVDESDTELLRTCSISGYHTHCHCSITLHCDIHYALQVNICNCELCKVTRERT